MVRELVRLIRWVFWLPTLADVERMGCLGTSVLAVCQGVVLGLLVVDVALAVTVVWLVVR